MRLALPRAPSSVHLALLGADSYAALLRTFGVARRRLAEVLSAAEFLDRASLELACEKLDGVRDPLPGRPCAQYMLVEVSGSDASHDEAKLSAFVDEAMESGDVVDGTIAQDGAQSAALWRLREGITEALGRTGRVYKYDVSLPLAQLYDLVEETRARMAPHGALVSGFGHLGDGNLHLNVCTPGAFDADAAVAAAIEPWVFEYIAERRGSISAEHGVGVMKPHVLHLSKRPPVISVMHAAAVGPARHPHPGRSPPPPEDERPGGRPRVLRLALDQVPAGAAVVSRGRAYRRIPAIRGRRASAQRRARRRQTACRSNARG